MTLSTVCQFYFYLYQVEGACNEGGRGPSIWDAFSHIPGIHASFRLLSHDNSHVNLCSSNTNFDFFPLFIFLGKIIDGSNGDVAVDQYHRYKVEN